MIKDVVSPHCGDKRMAWRCTRFSLPNYFVMTLDHIALVWNCIPTSRDSTSYNAVSSHNRQVLVENIVPTHYVCNKFI